MLGRAAYHDPWLLARRRSRASPATRRRPRSRADVLRALVPLRRARRRARGVPLRAIARHVLGLYHGVPGGRRYRRLLSEPLQLRDASPRLFLDAMAMVAGDADLTTTV